MGIGSLTLTLSLYSMWQSMVHLLFFANIPHSHLLEQGRDIMPCLCLILQLVALSSSGNPVLGGYDVVAYFKLPAGAPGTRVNQST